MPPRENVAEIREIQSRMGVMPPHVAVVLRINDVRSLIDGYDKPPEEALRYVPVGLVACLEAYFRAVVRELVDSGKPFLQRAENLERIPFNFRAVAAIHGRTITLGSLVAHLVPMNNKRDLNATMSTLLNDDFLEKLKEVREHWPWKPIASSSTESVISDPAIVFADLDRVFELRHVVCHEFGLPIHIGKSEAERYIASVDTFLSAVTFMVMKLLFKDIPDTQHGRNIYFEQKHQQAEQDLRAAIEAAEQEFKSERLEQFRKLQAAWAAYRDMDVDFVASEYEGARIWPQIRARRLEQLTRIRIAEIEQLVGELFETKLKRIVESK
jgi:uncharacterized protein YecT (DUF1311 family)